MLTIFTIPKPFAGDAKNAQENAIKSWKLLKPDCEIILMGNDNGVKEACEKFGLLYIPEIKTNEFGTPFLDSAFKFARERSGNDFLCYVNCDIVLMQDFMNAILQVKEKFSNFLAISQRWNLDIKEEIDFDDSGWDAKLKSRIAKIKTGPIGIDCFVFPRNLDFGFQPFLVGRPGWDNWFVWQTKNLKVPCIDITRIANVVHQNHDYAHWSDKQRSRIEIKNNLDIVKNPFHIFTPRQADWILSENGFEKQKQIPVFDFLRRFFGSLPIFYPYFNPLAKIIYFPFLMLSNFLVKVKKVMISL